MHALLIAMVMVVNVMFNPLASNPVNLDDYNAKFLNQFSNPVIEYTYEVNGD